MITISDVAAKAGVSRATVSYVLNDRNTAVRISDDTRQRVREAASHLGYRRNELARAVITGKNRMLGFWVMQSNREPVIRVLSGAMKEADERGYFIKMLGFDNGTVGSRIIEQCVEWRLSGIIAIHAPESTVATLHPQFIGSKIPIVAVDSQQPPAGIVNVASASDSGVRSVIEHLVGLGHRKIVFVAGEPDESDTISSLRASAYSKAMQELGMGRYEKVVHGRWEVEATERVVRNLLKPGSKANRPTAIACSSDHMAMVTVRTASQMGIGVPQDLSVTGFDDLSCAALYNPALTTVAQSFEEMGRIAVQQLLGRIEQKADNTDGTHQELLPTHLVVRRSTGPAA